MGKDQYERIITSLFLLQWNLSVTTTSIIKFIECYFNSNVF